MSLAVGTRLGPYEILSLLGAGGMGEVYRARDERLKRDVAIKVLPSSVTGDADRLRRFEVEAQAAGGLNHPNITAVFDIGAHEGAPYVVQELLEGETLRVELAGGRIPVRTAIGYAVQIAEGLAAAHEKGIVHRDLKPENLFVTKEGRVKILDFGLAKLTQPVVVDGGESTPTVPMGTEPGMVMGTIGYMSPEQVRGVAADHRSDIFALGTVLYEMVSGVRPFRGGSAVETMNAILKEDPPALTMTGREITPGLERSIRHCLEKNPAQRFQSARDLAYGLGTITDTSSSTVAFGAPAKRRVALPVLGLMGLVLAVLASGAFGGLWLLSRSSSVQVPSFRRLTFRRGQLGTARFAPDGRTIVYSASWEGTPSEVLTVRTDSIDSRPIGLSHANLLAVSSTGELAVRLEKSTFRGVMPMGRVGTLARIPIGGGSPRELFEDIYSADWAPNGEDLAVTRRLPDGKVRTEYPIGTALYDSTPGCHIIRVSPGGDRVACVERGDGLDFTISTLDRKGHKTLVSSGWSFVRGLTWSRRGASLVFVGSRTANDTALRELSLSGRERVLLSNAADLWLDDVAPDGSLLVTKDIWRSGMRCLPRGASSEREIGWLNRSMVTQISEDGSSVLFFEWGEGSGPKAGAYLRKTDGTPAVRLGDGTPYALSADGNWALSVLSGAPADIVMLPIGPGLPRKISVRGVVPVGIWGLPREKGLLILSVELGKGRMSVVGPEGGKARALPVEDLPIDLSNLAISPDGDRFAYASTDGRLKIQPIFAGNASTVLGPSLDLHDYPAQWSDDGRFVYLIREGELPMPIDRLEIATGRREPWRRLLPEDSAGVTRITDVTISRDGQSYAYSYDSTVASALYVVDGVK